MLTSHRLFHHIRNIKLTTFAKKNKYFAFAAIIQTQGIEPQVDIVLLAVIPPSLER